METTTTDDLATEHALLNLHGYGPNKRADLVRDAVRCMADVRDNDWQPIERGQSIFAVIHTVAAEWRGNNIWKRLQEGFMTDEDCVRFVCEHGVDDDPEWGDWVTEECERIAETIADALNAVVRVEYPGLSGTFSFGWNDGAYDLMYHEDAVIDPA